MPKVVAGRIVTRGADVKDALIGSGQIAASVIAAGHMKVAYSTAIIATSTVVYHNLGVTPVIYGVTILSGGASLNAGSGYVQVGGPVNNSALPLLASVSGVNVLFWALG
jgi:fructose-bisphosphate aldolase class 1